MSFTKFLTSIFLLVMLFTALSFAQDNDMMKKEMNKKEMVDKDKMMMHDDMTMNINKNMDGVAINGYDPVSYFTEGKPEMGMSGYNYKWMNAEWHFKNEDHLKMFKENPGKYSPQFGGFCAYGLCSNKMLPADPLLWTIENGKLYLNVNADAQKLFRKDAMNNINKAEMNWKMMDDKMDKNK